MQIKRFLILGASALLAACASGMKYPDMQASMPVIKSGEGRIYFYRYASVMGAGVQPEISLNGTNVGASVPGGFFFVDRPGGNYEASAITEVERKLTFVLAPGETKYIRTSPSFGVMVGHMNFELVNAPQAQSELVSLSYATKSNSGPPPASP
jgi:Protein of unknown function (DUF2846)